MRLVYGWRLKIIGVTLAGILPCAAQIVPGPCFNAEGQPCAGEVTQVLHKVIAAEQLAQVVLVLQNLIKNSLKSGVSFGQIAQELQVLNQAVLYGRGLAYSMGAIDRQWATAYPGVTQLSGYPPGGYASRYSAWARTANDSMVGAMMGASAAAGFRSGSAQGVLNGIRGLTLAADGWLKVQTAIATGVDQTNENLLALHQIGMTQVQAIATFNGYQIQKDAAGVMAREKFLQYVSPSKDPTVVPSAFDDIVR